MWISGLTGYLSKTSSKNRPKGSAFTSMQPKLLLPPILLILWIYSPSFLHSPLLHQPLLQPYTHPTYPLRILSSVWSTTGIIVVGEALPSPSASQNEDNKLHSLRYLRASHSILGGVWVGDRVAVKSNFDSQGTPLGDSIYSAFVLQEAVRLVNSTHKGEVGTWNNALIM